jgi:hypothetical protein
VCRNARSEGGTSPRAAAAGEFGARTSQDVIDGYGVPEIEAWMCFSRIRGFGPSGTATAKQIPIMAFVLTDQPLPDTSMKMEKGTGRPWEANSLIPLMSDSKSWWGTAECGCREAVTGSGGSPWATTVRLLAVPSPAEPLPR